MHRKRGMKRMCGRLALAGLCLVLTACASHESQVNDTYMYVPSRPAAPPAPVARDMAPPPAAATAPVPAPTPLPPAPTAPAAPPVPAVPPPAAKAPPPATPTPITPATPAAGKATGA